MNLSTVQIFTMPHWMAAAITGAVKNWLGIVTPALPQQPELVDQRPALLTNLCWWRLGPALLRTYTLRTVCRLALDNFSIQIYEHGPPARSLSTPPQERFSLDKAKLYREASPIFKLLQSQEQRPFWNPGQRQSTCLLGIFLRLGRRLQQARRSQL